MKLKDKIKAILNGEFEYNADYFDELYSNSKFWHFMSKHLCSTDSYIANIAYLFYGDTECPCCTFWRGLLIGTLVGFGIGVIL